MHDVLLYGLRGGLGETYEIAVPPNGAKKTGLSKAEYEAYKKAVAEYNAAYSDYMNPSKNASKPNWSSIEAKYLSQVSANDKNYSYTAPDGTKYTSIDKATYDKYVAAGKLYNDAYAIAYKYNFAIPKWADFAAGRGESILADYRAKAAGKSQQNGTVAVQNTTVTYSVLLPVSGNKYFTTTDKAEYEKMQSYISLYNECSKIASQYGFSQPTWAQFEAGQGSNILNQYNTLRANKIAADEAEAQRIKEEANAKAKAEAERVAAEAAERAAAAEKAAAERAEAAAKAKADQAAADKAKADKAKAEEAQRQAQQKKAAANAEAEAAKQNLPAVIQEGDAAAEVAVDSGAGSQQYNTTTTAVTGSKMPWWGWVLAAAGVGTVVYFVFGGKKKGKRK